MTRRLLSLAVLALLLLMLGQPPRPAGVAGVVNGDTATVVQGAVDAIEETDARADDAALPSLRSPLFAPARERALATAIAAEALSSRELMPVRAGPPGR